MIYNISCKRGCGTRAFTLVYFPTSCVSWRPGTAYQLLMSFSVKLERTQPQKTVSLCVYVLVYVTFLKVYFEIFLNFRKFKNKTKNYLPCALLNSPIFNNWFIRRQILFFFLNYWRENYMH